MAKEAAIKQQNSCNNMFFWEKVFNVVNWYIIFMLLIYSFI